MYWQHYLCITFLALFLLKKNTIFPNTFLFIVIRGGALDFFVNNPLAGMEGPKVPLTRILESISQICIQEVYRCLINV